ncbi:transcription factor bHLH52-like [Malania oleifera]|uniref:transcription factor bHLH52-like n=1 Tax=Malania oleifera TaxID=397392 RepID=UPI0025AE1B79|nr:transcription factor bHLH52-like [Malania oleifera]
MALVSSSSCSNMGTLLDPTIIPSHMVPIFHHSEEETDHHQLLTCCDGLDFPNNLFVDPLSCFDPINPFFFPETCTNNLLPCFPPFDPLFTHSSPKTFDENFDLDLDFDSCSYSKRQRYCYQEDNFTDQSCVSGFVPSSYSLNSDGLFLPLPTECYGGGAAAEAVVRKSGKVEAGCVSAQSIAARERRRKITEKTQELGKLIPGGSKMNTAEMLQSAFKYVKFMQAQVGILQSMESIQGVGDKEEFRALIASPIVQEKLYVEEKCLVPVDSIKTFTNHHEAQLNSFISSELNLLVDDLNK